MWNPKIRRAVAAALILALAPVLTCQAEDERQSLEELRNTVVNLLQALVDQGVISREKAQQMVQSAQAKAEREAGVLSKADEGAVRVPYVPQIVKDDIAKQVAAEVKPDVVADVIKTAKIEGWGVPGALADWLKHTRIYGDLTLREEGLSYGSNNAPEFNFFAINSAGGITQAGANAFLDTNESRFRFRGRARLGVESDITQAVTAGLRISTGNTNDLVSATQTLDGTAPYAFGIDELYVRLDERTARKFNWLTVVGGRFLNPYQAPTNLIFYQDLNFTGAAATARLGFGDGSAEQSNVFFTLGAHQLQEIQFSAHDKWLVGGQLGTDVRWGTAQKLRVSAAFFDYFNVTGRLNPADQPGLYNYTAPTFLRFGNTLFDIANNTNTPNSTQLFALASKYRLLNLNATYQYGIGGRYVLGLTADAVKNFGFNAAQVAANTGFAVAPRVKGYQTEVSFGDPLIDQANEWRVIVGYRYLQRDAVIDGYTDADFHFGGTNARGYYLSGMYALSHNLWARIRYMSANEIDGPTYNVDTFQIDLNTHF